MNVLIKETTTAIFITFTLIQMHRLLNVKRDAELSYKHSGSWNIFFVYLEKKSIIHEIIFHITFSTFVFAGDVPGCFRSMAAPVLIYSWSINIEPNGRYYCNQHCTTTSTYTYFGLKVNSFLNFQPFRWFISVCLSLYLTLSLKYYDLVWYLKRWRSKFENVQSLS